MKDISRLNTEELSLSMIEAVKRGLDSKLFENYSSLELADLADEIREANSLLSVELQNERYEQYGKIIDELETLVGRAEAHESYHEEAASFSLDPFSTMITIENALIDGRLNYFSSSELKEIRENLKQASLDHEEQKGDLYPRYYQTLASLNDLISENKLSEAQATLKPSTYACFSANGQNEFKSHIKFPVPAKTAGKTSDQAKIMVKVKHSPYQTPVTPASLEDSVKYAERVVPEPAKPSRIHKLANALTKGAAYLVGGALALVSLNYFASDRQLTENAYADYHGVASAEVGLRTYVNQTISQVKPAQKETVQPAVETAAPEPVNPAPVVTAKVSPRNIFRPQVVEPVDEQGYPLDTRTQNAFDDYKVQAGDTLAGLYEDYAARGGSLSWKEYMITIQLSNPQIENVNKIYFGSSVRLPGY